jgi:hypothetical protein
MMHDHNRHGTTLFAALSVLDGTVIARCMQRPRPCRMHPFINAAERDAAADKPPPDIMISSV